MPHAGLLRISGFGSISIVNLAGIHWRGWAVHKDMIGIVSRVGLRQGVWPFQGSGIFQEGNGGVRGMLASCGVEDARCGIASAAVLSLSPKAGPCCIRWYALPSVLACRALEGPL